MPSIDPTAESLRRFASAPDDRPVVMVNLLKFRGEEGRRSYDAYVRGVAPLIAARGGRVVHRGRAGAAVIGEEAWDEVILVEYPRRAVLLEMLRSDEYRAIAHHRTEALVDSRLFPTEALPVAAEKGTS
jgi:uncharacterized protein (DUF1330 family)